MTTYKEAQPQETQDQATQETAITNAQPQEMPILSTGNATLPAPWCSFKADTLDQKKRLYRAMTNPDAKLSDCINMVINLTDAYVEWAEVTHDQTGGVEQVPRVVLFDADGKTYTATSKGIYNSLYRLFVVFGVPHWETPIPVKIRQVQNGERRYYSLDIA